MQLHQHENKKGTTPKDCLPSQVVASRRRHCKKICQATDPEGVLALQCGVEASATSKHPVHITVSSSFVQRIHEGHGEQDAEHVRCRADPEAPEVRAHLDVAGPPLDAGGVLGTERLHVVRLLGQEAYGHGQEQRGVDRVALHLAAHPAGDLGDAVDHEEGRPARGVVVVVGHPVVHGVEAAGALPEVEDGIIPLQSFNLAVVVRSEALGVVPGGLSGLLRASTWGLQP
mmetsp:Transcript_101484/g.295739  ORF Transcript_101484/g.295739 Transcript_101484/m.295739 type:complete len:229 (+) Transcript_101484:598-1284(+)